MNNYLAKLLVCIGIVCASNVTLAQEDTKVADPVVKQQYAENYVFADPNKRKAFLAVTSELRCPKCQNQSIAGSDAPISHDMRRKTYQLMQEGKSKDEVIAWMKVRYGDFVYYQPPVNAVTIWLWLLPVLFAGLMFVFFIRRRKPELSQDVEAKLAKADQMLKDD
jgi:cytochrome c-type biogenesis protein CcmH